MKIESTIASPIEEIAQAVKLIAPSITKGDLSDEMKRDIIEKIEAMDHAISASHGGLDFDDLWSSPREGEP